MNSDQQSNDHWNACPPGELVRMAGQLDARDRRTRTRRMFGAAAMSMLLIASGVLAVGSISGPAGIIGGIDCAECQKNFATHHYFLNRASLEADAGEFEPLDPELQQCMLNHLTLCERCREAYLTKYPGAAFGEVTSVGQPLLAHRWFRFTDLRDATKLL